MVQNELPGSWYKERITRLSKLKDSLLRKRRLLAVLRLVLMGGAFIALWCLWTVGILIAIAVFLLLIAFFLFTVSIDLKNNQEVRNTENLIAINQTELKAFDHDFAGASTGEYLSPDGHHYAGDLDIFGKVSLYQFCNRTVSHQGGQLLASWLLSPAPNETIKERQRSVREIAKKPEWRQQLQAIGINDKISMGTQEKISGWLQQENRFITKKYWRWLQFILPAAGLAAILLYSTGVFSSQWFYAILFLFFIISLYISKLVMPEYRQLNKIASEVETLSHSMAHIEKERFETMLLSGLRNSLMHGQTSASSFASKLKSILDRLDYRLNPLVFIPLNTILFWDLHQVVALEKWKKENKIKLITWFSVLAEIEVLSSFGNVHFNHPGWCFPELSEAGGIFISENLGHPLIHPGKRVTSSFSTQGLAQISLVTGSNMAGKSTFLRSIGVNIVLAMAGSPVCATSLQVSNLKVMSSMRVNDNLEESTSTFYAELKKLKLLIEAVNRKEKVILLLDEILRGTNSADRHTGSTALIKQLIHHDAVGLVATHDLELAKLESAFPGHIHNYHFDVQVANEELYFDYKLKRGVCTSMNASLLMKKIGIEL